MKISKQPISLWTGTAFLFGVIGLLGVVAWVSPNEPIDLGFAQLRMPRIADLVSAGPTVEISADERMETVEAEMVLTAADSARMALADTLALYQDFFARSETSIKFPNEDYTYLFRSFRAMEQAGQSANRVAHVLHYGDSQIEGDRISCLLRDSLQALFGGGGPGLLPLLQPISARSVGQTLTDTVPMYYAGGIMGRRADHKRYGALAQMAELNTDSLTMGISARRVGGFRRLMLYVGHTADSLVARVGDNEQRAEANTEALQILTWPLTNSREVQMTLKGKADIYGVEVDGGRGVSLTNIPMRGADGFFLNNPDGLLMADMMRSLGVELILLEFGGNALPMISDTAQVTRYVRGLGKTIERVRSMSPKTPMILIGPADMSVTVDGTLQTHPMLPDLTAKMRQMCNDHNLAFWDMYAVMGGRNSMLAWVSHQPAWAGGDYVHFTPRGADRIASILWRALSMNYEYMKLTERYETEHGTRANE